MFLMGRAFVLLILSMYKPRTTWTLGVNQKTVLKWPMTTKQACANLRERVFFLRVRGSRITLSYGALRVKSECKCCQITCSSGLVM